MNKSSPESPAKEQPGEVAAMVAQLRMHAGASDTHIPRPMLARAAAMIEKLGQSNEVIQGAWNFYNENKMDADEFACVVATELQLYTPPTPERP